MYSLFLDSGSFCSHLLMELGDKLGALDLMKVISLLMQVDPNHQQSYCSLLPCLYNTYAHTLGLSLSFREGNTLYQRSCTVENSMLG